MKFLFFCTLLFSYLCLLKSQSLFASTKFELNPDLPIEDFVIAGLNKDEKPAVIKVEVKKRIDEVVVSTTTILSTTRKKSTIIKAYSKIDESALPLTSSIASNISQINNINQFFISNNLSAQNIQPLQPLVKLPALLTLPKINKHYENFNYNNKNKIENSERWFIENFDYKGFLTIYDKFLIILI